MLTWSSASIVTFALVPASLEAQNHPTTSFGLFGGFAIENGQQNLKFGLQFGGSFKKDITPELTARFDLSYQHFAPVPPPETPPCFPPGCPPGPDPLKLLSSTASLGFIGRGGFTITTGLGLYKRLEGLNVGSYVRPGWNVGVVVPIGQSAFIEMRYHGLIGPQATRGLFPISLGVRL